MGLFSSLFGSGQPSDECKFETLRDDGVRAMQMGELPYAEKCLVAARALRSDSRVTALLAEVYLRQRRFEAARARQPARPPADGTGAGRDG